MFHSWREQITVTGIHGYMLMLAYLVLAIASWARVFIDTPSRMAVFGHVCVALAWSFLAGRALDGLWTTGIALQAVPTAVAGIMLFALSSTAHIAHALIINRPHHSLGTEHAHGR